MVAVGREKPRCSEKRAGQNRSSRTTGATGQVRKSFIYIITVSLSSMGEDRPHSVFTIHESIVSCQMLPKKFRMVKLSPNLVFGLPLYW